MVSYLIVLFLPTSPPPGGVGPGPGETKPPIGTGGSSVWLPSSLPPPPRSVFVPSSPPGNKPGWWGQPSVTSPFGDGHQEGGSCLGGVLGGKVAPLFWVPWLGAAPEVVSSGPRTAWYPRACLPQRGRGQHRLRQAHSGAPDVSADQPDLAHFPSCPRLPSHCNVWPLATGEPARVTVYTVPFLVVEGGREWFFPESGIRLWQP